MRRHFLVNKERETAEGSSFLLSKHIMVVVLNYTSFFLVRFVWCSSESLGLLCLVSSLDLLPEPAQIAEEPGFHAKKKRPKDQRMCFTPKKGISFQKMAVQQKSTSILEHHIYRILQTFYI